MRFGERPFGTYNALSNCRLGDEKGPGDLIRCQTAEQAQSESNPRLCRENWMAGDEDESQEIIPHIVIRVQFTFVRQLLLNFKVAAHFLRLALEPYVPANQI